MPPFYSFSWMRALLAACAAVAAHAAFDGSSIHSLTFSAPLNAFLAAVTSSDAHSVTQAGAHAHVDTAALERVKQCAREHVQPESPIMQAKERVPASQLTRVHAREHIIMQTLRHTYPHVCALTRCLLRANVTHPSLLTTTGPKLLYAAMGSVGSCTADDSLGLVRTLLQAGPMFNFHMRLRNRTRGGVSVLEDADAYTLLHKALDRDKLLVADMASRVLQPRAVKARGSASNVIAAQQREYDDMLTVIVRTLGSAVGVSDAMRARINTSLQHLTHANIRGMDKSVVLGRSVAAADVQALCNALSTVTLSALLTAMREYEADAAGNSSTGNLTVLRKELSAIPQPRLSQLLCTRDKYGRTPMHMAAVTNNDEAVRLLEAEVLRLMQVATVAHDDLASCALFSRDVWGYTPRQLAEASNAAAAASVLSDAEKHIAAAVTAGTNVEALQEAADARDAHRIPMRQARPLRRVLRRTQTELATRPFDDVFVNDTTATQENGGWTSAKWVAPHTRAALQAAWEGGAAARDCDFDVLEPHELTPQKFLRDYFLPGRPVRIRGLSAAWRERAHFTRLQLLQAHGKANFSAGDIPYARMFGRADTTLSLAQYVLGSTTCDPVTRQLRVEDDALEGILAATRMPVTHSLCDMFLPSLDGGGAAAVRADGSVSKAKSATAAPAAGGYDASTGRSYIFNTLDPSSPLSRRLAADMRLLPDFLNVTVPLWNAGDDEVDLEHIVVDTSLAPQFYVGPAGTGAPMHYHEDAWNALMYGEKRWYMQPPAYARYSTVPIIDFVVDELPRLRARIAAAAAEGRVDMLDPEPLQCTQQAGDALYVPRGWGHAVLNMRTSVGYAVEFATALDRY